MKHKDCISLGRTVSDDSAACPAARAAVANLPAKSSPHLPCFLTPQDQHRILT